ncbi:MAG: hypothetical protein IID15_08405, partial [Candidatus Marinimicrobia bacterium]|nr:hypothetical protein [Candidatus Neomarinimicrobiota bacterium]
MDRGEVFFFGSDTHWPTELERGESNSLWRLNLETLSWSKDYQQDDKSSYIILPDSQCVTSSGRPWAMHTFDAVVYDPEVGRLVVVGQPTHTRFEPEKRFPMFEGDWYKSLAPSHWEYDPESKEWTLLLNASAPNLFARSMILDSRRNVLIAHDGARTWLFNRQAGHWKVVAGETGQTGRTIPGYHLSMVYDSYADAALLLGKNGGSDTLFTFDPHKKSWARAQVSGRTLPANGAALAYDTRNSVMLY